MTGTGISCVVRELGVWNILQSQMLVYMIYDRKWEFGVLAWPEILDAVKYTVDSG
jgi:hypothetical protein